jgi:hypothetical protein
VAAAPTLRLALHAPPGSRRQQLCTAWRNLAGRLRAWLPAGSGFVSGREAAVHALEQPPAGSLLRAELPGFHYQDTFVLRLQAAAVPSAPAAALLADLLQGFLEHRPAGVTRLMQLRNLLVRPLRLRTSPLGCPVSSLLAADARAFFANRYPVLEQRIDPDGRHAQVILGADDRHLSFRSCVGVALTADGIELSLGTRVRCRNAFGQLYMALIHGVHRRYITPAMLRAAAQALSRRHAGLSAVPGLFA